MKKNKFKIFLLVLTAAIFAWQLKNVFEQPNVNDLKGGFAEKASYRNQNNTGPVLRIYSVSVKDTVNAELEAYGNLMPHHKYGNTKVYFFKEGTNIPLKLYPGEVNFDPNYAKNCFAVYEKSAMGNFNVTFNPF